MKTNPDSKSLVQLLRYGLMGVAINLSLYTFYVLVTYLGMAPKPAMTLAYLIGVSIGFIGHRNWTFSHRGGVLGAGLRFCIAHLLGYLLNLLLLLVFVDRLGYPHQLVQAAAILVVAAFLFIIFKFFVFPKGKPAQQS